MNNLLQINLFSYLHDNDKVLFCKTDFLSSAFYLISKLSHDVILITGNSDYEINDSIRKQGPSNIKYWFAQNANCDNIFSIPIGLENTLKCNLDGHGVVWPHAEPKHNIIFNAKEKKPSKSVYCNFSLSTNPSVRSLVYNNCLLNKDINCDICSDHNEINKKNYSDYIQDILDHEMVICPEGNGIDCHRVWETLLLGRVPIVRKSKVMNDFSDLPILYIDDWDEIKDSSLINEKYNSVKDNSTEKLNFKYWENLILSYRSKL